MKIRVTLMLLLCTSISANSRKTIGANWPSLTKAPPHRKEFSKFSEPGHRVYEYSRNIEAINVDFKNEIFGSQSHTTTALHHSNIAKMNNQPNDLLKSLERTKRSVPNLGIVKSSEQSSRNPEHDSSQRKEKVLSRAKKSKMSQAILPLLMAYKLKFAALIPILLGGMSLLVSTTTLAGFFFALFAAVLGLKAH